MFRCPKCHNTDKFLVDETARQLILISCDADGVSYTYVQDEEFIDVVEWHDISCDACGYVSTEETLRETYADSCSADTPIPYTLDASVS